MWLARTTLLSQWSRKIEKQNQSWPGQMWPRPWTPHLRGPHPSSSSHLTHPIPLPWAKTSTHKYCMAPLEFVFLLPDHTRDAQDPRLPDHMTLSSLPRPQWDSSHIYLSKEILSHMCTNQKPRGDQNQLILSWFVSSRDRVNYKASAGTAGAVGRNWGRTGHHNTKESKKANLAFQLLWRCICQGSTRVYIMYQFVDLIENF